MKGLRTGVAKTEVLRVYPMKFDEKEEIALYAKFNFNAANYGTCEHHTSALHSPGPMDISQSEGEEAELRAVGQQLNSVDVNLAGAQNASIHTVSCESCVSIGRSPARSRPRKREWCGKL